MGGLGNHVVEKKDEEITNILASRGLAAERVYGALRHLVNPRNKSKLQNKIFYKRKKK